MIDGVILVHIIGVESKDVVVVVSPRLCRHLRGDLVTGSLVVFVAGFSHYLDCSLMFSLL